VTRGTRPKKPSYFRGFACEARGAWGSWGLKTENRNFLSLFKPATTTKKICIYYFILFYFCVLVRADNRLRPQGGRGGHKGRGGKERNECIRADASHVRADGASGHVVSSRTRVASVRTRLVRADARVRPR
jgi:hypothetical protein